MEKNRLSTISQAITLQEMGEFWDEHDFTEFDTDAPDVEFTISSSISIEPDLLMGLDQQAQLRYIIMEAFINLWLHEN